MLSKSAVSASLAIILLVMVPSGSCRQSPDDTITVSAFGLPLKSPSTALRYSLLGTVIPVAAGTAMILFGEAGRTDAPYEDSGEGWATATGTFVVFTGVLAGPTMGHFYAEHPGRAVLGMLLRLSLAAGTLGGSFAACGWDCGPGDDGYTWGWVIFVGGSAAVAGSMAWDMVSTRGSVERYNRKAQMPSVSLAPIYSPENKSIGLSFSLRF